MNLRVRPVAVALLAAVAASRLFAAGPPTPYGRACLLTLTPPSAAGGTVPAALAVFDPGAAPAPAPGRQLRLVCDSNRPGFALAAAFPRGGEGLANDWRPALVELGEFEEQTLPTAPTVWRFERAPAVNLDVFVAFLSPEDAQPLRPLVAAMLKTDAAPVLLAAQTGKLREHFDRWQAGRETAALTARARPVNVAAAFRSATDFPWREAAAKVEFSPGHPGVLVFPVPAAAAAAE